MKKILIAAALFVAMGFASCGNSPASKAAAFSEEALAAMKAGDLEKAAAVEGKIEEYVKTLSPEEQKAFAEALTKWAEEHAQEISEAQAAIAGGIGEAVEEAAGEIEDAVEDATEEIEEAVEEAAE